MTPALAYASESLLDETRHTALRVQIGKYLHDATARIVSASSGRLDRIAGHGWTAVGDAAVCYDPFSAHGLTLALPGGCHAAVAVAAHLSGDDDGLRQYVDRLNEAYTRYTTMRREHYTNQKRWPEAPFWSCRATVVGIRS